MKAQVTSTGPIVESQNRAGESKVKSHHDCRRTWCDMQTGIAPKYQDCETRDENYRI